MVGPVVHRERHPPVCAVDRARGREDHVRGPVTAAALEQVGEADDVAPDVLFRVREGVAHAGLGGKVHDPVRRLGSEELLERGAVAEIGPSEAKTLAAAQVRDPRLLERRVVVAAEAVQARHAVATREQAPAKRRADESGGPRHQDLHPTSLRASSLRRVSHCRTK